MASEIFNFDAQRVFAQSIEVEDIGNCALRCSNKDCEEYYVIMQTIMGKTFILKFGPLIADLDAIDSNFELSYKKIDYKEKTISFEINKLLTDGKKLINNVEVIKITEALEMIPTSEQFIPL